MKKGTKKTTNTPNRLHRRTPQQLMKVANKIATLVASAEDGLRAEDIRKGTKLSRKEIPRALKLALEQKLLTANGTKRATTYYATAIVPKGPATPQSVPANGMAVPIGKRIKLAAQDVMRALGSTGVSRLEVDLVTGKFHAMVEQTEEGSV